MRAGDFLVLITVVYLALRRNYWSANGCGPAHKRLLTFLFCLLGFWIHFQVVISQIILARHHPTPGVPLVYTWALGAAAHHHPTAGDISCGKDPAVPELALLLLPLPKCR